MIAFVLAAALAAEAPVFIAKPCANPSVSLRARCGTVDVPEDRSNVSGRRIKLNVVVIAAASPGDERRALFDFDGGPGLADTKNAGFYLGDGAGYAERRDVVLIDQRGTGESNPLDCPEFDAADRSLEPMFPAAAVQSCRERLSRSADLTRYTTDAAVADVEAVRQALGYDKIDLIALSYGTTLALRYVALHEQAVRSIVLVSAVPATAMPPRHHAAAAQAGLDWMMDDCAADHACSARHPRLRHEFDLALKRLGPQQQIAMERLRTKLYSPPGTRQLPRIISRLAEGDTGILTTSNERASFNYFDGLYLTITCSESLPWFDIGKASSEAQRTVFGDYRIARQRAACANWPRSAVAPDFFAAVRSSVPMLLLSGARDPVTPPRWAADVARGFPRSRHIVIPWAGHVVDGLEGLENCFDPQVIRFLDTADPKSVNQSCFSEMMPPPFE